MGAEVSRSTTVPNRYLDSVALLRLSAELAALDGISAATAVMATPANLERARENGIEVPAAASPNDLFVGVRGTADACDAALALAVERLSGPEGARGASSGTAVVSPPRSIAQHVRRGNAADLALISVPGAFAAAEAGKALDLGMHVMLFSDNVSLEDEVALKRDGAERGLLVMGPDCGTAIVNGVPLGFANAVRHGPVAVVGASGTGMQEVTARVHRLGSGVSQAIGCGGRDLSEAVGAATMCQALAMLADDPATEVVVLVSKPPHPDVLARVVDAAAPALARGASVVAAFLGLPTGAIDGTGLVQAPSLAAAADLAVALAGPGPTPSASTRPLPHDRHHGRPGGRLLRGAFTGGTFCYEALAQLDALGVHCASNLKGGGSDVSSPEHLLVDFGDDEFTVGRPHPMIDPSVRDAWVDAALARPDTAVVLLDVVLGHGSNPHPVDGLLTVFERHRLGEAADAPLVVAHVCGTELDAPSRDRIVALLSIDGVLVADSNDEAAAWAAAALLEAGR